MEKNNMPLWADGIAAAITVCDKNGIIMDMNNNAASLFAAQGGRELIGRGLEQCHNKLSMKMIQEMLETGTSNSYVIEKNGKRRIIHQTPWHEQGRVSGLVEISFEINADLLVHKK